jgi:hypothetical protein
MNLSRATRSAPFPFYSAKTNFRFRTMAASATICSFKRRSIRS